MARYPVQEEGSEAPLKEDGAPGHQMGDGLPQIIQHRKEDSAWIHLEMSKTTTKTNTKTNTGKKTKTFMKKVFPYL